jgi:hypothetical protein
VLVQARYQRLIRENVELKGMLETGKADQADIYFFLQKKLDDSYNIINDLETQIVQASAPRQTRTLTHLVVHLPDLASSTAYDRLSHHPH